MASDALLTSLRPSMARAVMDLVAEAGVDVSGWARKQGGAAVANPRANPHYCYEWSFGQGNETRVVCVWHGDLATAEQGVVYRGNMKALAAKLGVIAREPWRLPDVRSRAKNQQKRAQEFDYVVHRAHRLGLPLRVILLVGEGRAESELGLDASKVSDRQLDSALWRVASYEHRDDGDDGRFVLLRGEVASSYPTTGFGALSVSEDEAPDDEAEPQGTETQSRPTQQTPVIDQFVLSVDSATREISGQVYVRSPEVRRQVLQRSQGLCEWCGLRGFETASGALYLETHHVVPLCEQGADHPLNVLALCANDHRRAHFGADATTFRTQLLERLAALMARQQ